MLARDSEYSSIARQTCAFWHLFFLHRLRHGVDRTTAENDLKKIWKPEAVLREFVNVRLAEIGQAPL